MKRLLAIVALVCSLVIGTTVASAKPITKQNGSTPLFRDFESICGLPGFLYYGYCSGDASKFNEITGRINAVQAKPGVWNLGISFKNLTPGALYRLWGNRDPATPTPGVVVGFFVIGTVVAAGNGSAEFSYQTNDPSYLSFDLNFLPTADEPYGFTFVTSYWSDQRIQVLNPDGTLYVPTP